MNFLPEDLAAHLAACEREPVPSADLDGVVIQDYELLWQHCAFVKLAMQDPTFADRALAALTGWLNISE